MANENILMSNFSEENYILELPRKSFLGVRIPEALEVALVKVSKGNKSDCVIIALSRYVKEQEGKQNGNENVGKAGSPKRKH